MSVNGEQSTSSGASRNSKKSSSHESLWDYDDVKLDAWARGVHALFPKMSAKDSKPSSTQVAQLAVATQVWANLKRGLTQLTVQEEEVHPDNEVEEVEERPKKRSKPMRRKFRVVMQDPFDMYSHTVQKDDEEADTLENIRLGEELLGLPAGGKMCQMTVSGILNGMAGVQGGLVKNKRLELKQPDQNDTTMIPISTSQQVPVSQLKLLAKSFYRAMHAHMERDVLITTPLRIQQMLAPDLQPHEFKAIRKRIYDTVILGKGLAVNVEDDDVPIAGKSTDVHDMDKNKRCKTCGNNDQSLFVLDRKNGDVICSNCGTVALESLMHEGSQFRKFEGEIDRNHHGDAPNPLYSNAHNMATTLGGMQATTGAGLGGFGTQKQGLEAVLRNAHAFTELNISQFGKGDRRTRIGYKDKQKRDAFIQMTHCGDALNLHEAVVQRAKELFAGFRDDRELVQQFKGVIAACLCEAFDQLSKDGKQILKQQEEDMAFIEDAKAGAEAQYATSVRAMRRNELHHANLAGKGGLLIDYSAVTDKVKENASSGTPMDSSVSKKTCSTWDLDDCRSWLLEASRNIAKRWVEDRKKDPSNDKIPPGSQNELEGKLVEYSFALCEALEVELRAKSAKTNNLPQKRALHTPRAANMGNLSIKWQREGGLGGAARTNGNKNAGGRTAGQVLILKTAKKLASILQDPVAAEAFHTELRGLVAKQEEVKRQKMRDEATRQRLVQMKRKPWLQARAQVS